MTDQSHLEPSASPLVSRPSVGVRRAAALAAAFLLCSAPVRVHAEIAVRTIDGRSNNLEHPRWGSAGTPLRRVTSVAYADGLAAPAGPLRPSARAVSNAVAAQLDPLPNAAGLSNLFWQWGQFVDHDVDLSGANTVIEPFDIAVPAGDPFFDPLATGEAAIAMDRSRYTLDPTTGIRQQINEITAYIDASNVYGSDPLRAAALRDEGDSFGRLRHGRRRQLPKNIFGLPNAPSPAPAFYLAGDVRANEQVGLTSLHTVFLREHNRLAKRTRLMRFAYREMAGRDAVEVDADTRYELARMLVGAEIQAITYNEFLPLLLGNGALAPYSGYRSEVDAGIANEFATAAYRFGHTMVSSLMPLRNRAMGPMHRGDLELLDAFFSPQLMAGGRMVAPLVRGLASTLAQEVDTRVIDDLRNFLFGPPGSGGFDLAALNIQRGRDHGLPGYNQARIDLGLIAATDFAGLTSDVALQAALATVYENVDAVDLWVGGLAEDDQFAGGLVGELFFTILRDQFERLRDGDRFWYQNHLTPALVEYVESRSLAKILRRNSGCRKELSSHPFLAAG